MDNNHIIKKYLERERGSVFCSGVRTARERPCRRRNLLFSSLIVSLLLLVAVSYRMLCLSSEETPSFTVVSCLEGRRIRMWSMAWERGLYVWFREREATADPLTPAFPQEVKVQLLSPTPVWVPEKGRLSMLRLRRSWLRRIEAYIALPCRLGSRNLLGFWLLVWLWWFRIWSF